ncbi:Mitochondrial 37S ribosomal protein S27 [Neolecta irregularis DAH-3]|uniref:Small ribosomal subunit protein mS33 n=1 Tax=Neolecta irregularis (strain DAH-3) TaxID=1198029 RepID=A0A1U7LH63_NEOID|nr:Mitochondrial 37S ribosomal protein S27 [Neolecta irregularis DAH-3]|eukprot:OLL21968.1 Mitochondrial 37S ribosomal protein S27 [Neolecta irregularis DAH-3]
MAPPVERLQALAKASAKIFGTTFNPTAIRTGNKVLRQRLRGPTLLDYYPRPIYKFKDIRKFWPNMGLDTVGPVLDEPELERLEDIALRKERGKSAPKKGAGKRATSGKKR